MNSPEEKIPFKFEVSRMIELLATQIYQSPLALLRENTQNAFDAIRMRAASGEAFTPKIQVTVDSQNVVVADNGIGMSKEDIKKHFWYSGKSGKNTPQARAAGVVGTFGIGAMSNFGVADELRVESESTVNGKRTLSYVLKSELLKKENSISIKSQPAKGEPGTTVLARLAEESSISVDEARNYLRQFVEFVDIEVLFNGKKISGARYRDELPSEKYAWHEELKDVSLAGIISGKLRIFGMATGELRIILEDIHSESGLGQTGTIVLLQERNAIRTLRTGFGLAVVTMQSVYQWGGVVDLPFLVPTAGREALDASSNQQLQQIISALDSLVSSTAANHNQSFSNNCFLHWIINTGRYRLCGPLEVSLRPINEAAQLASLVNRKGLRYYPGRDESVIRTYASEEEPLIVLSRRSPRRDCELNYLRIHEVPEVDTQPKVEQELSQTELSLPQSALAIRISRIIEDDYFIEIDVLFGRMTGGLSLLIVKESDPIRLYLDPDSASIAPILALYYDDFDAFNSFIKDFIRSTVFPRISQLVPSSTREGAEAFLRHLRSNREWFEYESSDKADLDEILEELRAGRLTIAEARKRIIEDDRSFVEVNSTGTASLSTVVQEVDNEDTTDSDPLGAVPSIDRRERETDALILTSDEPVKGYKCFLALSDRVYRRRGEFFLQPHSTQVVWGGQRVIFVFQHHSKRFSLYYDILCPRLVREDSGGGPRITATILAKNRIFIPIPDEIVEIFSPKDNERIRLEVRCDLLYPREE